MANESVQQLFSKYTVVEIRELGKKTRQEIETKKEELRQMVGERYRDLIETADTIAVMKKCASSLKDSVCSLQKYTANEIKNVRPKRAKLSSADLGLSVDSYLNLSAQVKLLMEVSETIWSHVERGKMIEATHLYMQSRQVLKNLRLDGSTTYCPILQWFPVLGQQAQALDNLRTTILSECRQLLKDDQLHSKTISEAMCSIILLENTSISAVFTEFMNARFSAINGKFDSLHEVGTSKLCKVVMLLAATLKQANLLFVAPVDCVTTDEKNLIKNSNSTPQDIGLVQHVLKKSYESFSEKWTDFEKAGGIFEEKCWSKHLPDSVSKLSSMNVDSQSTSPATSSEIQSTCLQWLENCKQSIKKGANELLTYVNTFKALATMRQSLWDTLEEVGDIQRTATRDQWKIESLEQGDNKNTEWEEACLLTLGRRLSLWDEILKALFLDKVKSLSEKSLSNLLASGKQKLNDTLEGLEAFNKISESTNQFIWRELPSDILQDTAWKQVSVKKGKEEKGGLGLKALTVTPALHNMCQQLNSGMRQVLNDLSHYIPNIDTPLTSLTNNERKSSNDDRMPLVSKEERLKISSNFEQACVHCLREFLNVLNEYRESLTQKLTSEKSCVDEILFLAMFCRNFCQLCDEFHTGCVISTNMPEAPLKRQLSTSMTESMMARATQPVVSPIWEEIGNDMSAQSNKFLKLWFTATVDKAIYNFKVSFLNLKSAIHFFDTMPTWDNVKIQEESEAGSKVESEIKLPMTVSWSVQELLYFVCDDISKVGGHSMSRSTLQDITRVLLSGILQTFIDIKEAVTKQDHSVSNTDVPGSLPFTVTQSWALQKLYDLRTLHGLLYAPQQQKSQENKSLDDNYSDLVDWLESYIDPFDLDVFAPHLTKNIQKSVHSCSVMLGFITPSDKSDTMQSSHSISKSGGSSHNILPLTADLGRFSYLPISSRMSKPDTVSLPASVKNHLPLSSALKQLTDADKKMEGGRKQSLYSKLGALGSSWLSSMATSEN